MNWKSTRQKLTEEEIKEIQDSYKVVFPEDFRKHYLEFNGGKPDKRYFLHRKITFFQPFKYGENTIERTYDMINDVLPKGFIPFAHDGGGWPFSISLNTDDFGSIYFCPLDGDEPEFLVGSFSKFLDGLSIEEVA